MIYFIADTHFNDEDIIAYEKRPFKSVEEMNNHIIDQCNSVLKDDDTLIIVGDFMKINPFNRDIDTLNECKSILKRMRGYKWLIKGNHDIVQSARYQEYGGFEEVSSNPIILEEFFIVSHMPMYVSSKMPYANIFGHVHNNPIYRDYSDRHCCVSAERIHYQPLSFDEIKERMRKFK